MGINYSFTLIDDLVNVYISGSQRQRGYTDVDYDTLFKNIQKEKEVSKTRHDKIKRLVSKSKRSKEQDMIKEHKKAWRKMYNLLGVQVRVYHFLMFLCVTNCIGWDVWMYVESQSIRSTG